MQYDEIQFDNKSHEVQVFSIDMIFVPSNYDKTENTIASLDNNYILSQSGQTISCCEAITNAAVSRIRATFPSPIIVAPDTPLTRR